MLERDRSELKRRSLLAASPQRRTPAAEQRHAAEEPPGAAGALPGRVLAQQAGVWSAGKGVERFALAPEWLFGGWVSRGMYGFWDARMAGSPPRQVCAFGWGPAQGVARAPTSHV